MENYGIIPVPEIDPIIHRQLTAEKRSFWTAFTTLTATCSNVPKSAMATGGDISKWQGVMDWNKYFDNGMEFTIIRAMINGNVDEQFERNAEVLTTQGRRFGIYGATGYPVLANAIPYARKLADLSRNVGNLGIWWDSELSGLLNPSEMAKFNAELLGELSALLPERKIEIYTRQSFWDSSVAPGNWSKYPLAAARYNEYLSCPWSDGKFEFRDWDDWLYWQDSQWYDGYAYGAQSANIDHLYFNGTLDDLELYYGMGVIPEPEDCLWKFRVVVDMLNYRSEPLVTPSTLRGYFKRDDVIPAIRTVTPQRGQLWLQFQLDGMTYYSALHYNGTQYCIQES